MENTNYYHREVDLMTRLGLTGESLLNITGVILFYVVVIVAFSVFSIRI